MKLKEIKEKLKNKVQESKTKQFVEEHKGISLVIGGVVLGVGTMLLTHKIYVHHKVMLIGQAQDYGFVRGVLMSSDSFDKAIVKNNLHKDNLELYKALAEDSTMILKDEISKSEFNNLLRK